MTVSPESSSLRKAIVTKIAGTRNAAYPPFETSFFGRCAVAAKQHGLALLAGLAWLVCAPAALAQVGAASSAPAQPQPSAAPAFGFEQVAELARKRAARAYRAPDQSLPPALAKLNYDQHRDIRFRTERALWRTEKLPFETMFFHMGWLFKEPVRVNEITAKGVQPFQFNAADFHYGKNQLDAQGFADIGFAGLRVHFPLNSQAYKDEAIVFLGASYFRALSRGARYGLSARGLAIDTVGGNGEEFPRFTEFWLQRPQTDSQSLTIYALLDSPRATGAYRFVLTPGVQTELEVQSRVYLRGPVATLGIAPLTSMFLSGENQRLPDDFRPEVHDSDGLSVLTGEGEWIWRPLINPRRVLTTSFKTTNPHGFGLMQRDRAFSSYEDLEARYELRPSVWVQPVGDWGEGRVELTQIPTEDEFGDNIVAYWVPAKLPAPGEPLNLSYRMLWQMQTDQRPPQSWVTQTRRGYSWSKLAEDEFKFVVDFDGPALRALSNDAEVQANFTAASNAEIVETNVYRHEVAGGFRSTVRIKRLNPAQPVELRGFLQHKQPNSLDTVSETWSYLLPPQ